MTTERRSDKRYPASGRLLFRTKSGEAAGDLIDIARIGAFIRSEVKPFEGEEITVWFAVQDHTGMFEVSGIVVRVQSDSWAMMFLEEPVKLEKLLRSLAEKVKEQVVRLTDT